MTRIPIILLAMFLVPGTVPHGWGQDSRSNTKSQKDDKPKGGSQKGDAQFEPKVALPRFESGKGPVIRIDEAHHNFHVRTGRYAAFAKLLEAEGYRVESQTRTFSRETLKGCKVLVISNPIHQSNLKDWKLPCPSAFTKEEISALKQWVCEGGSLLLIADHMPFAGAANDLAKVFGAEFDNGFVFPRDKKSGPMIFEASSGLNRKHETVLNSARPVKSVATFTGSAFRANHCFCPILVLPEGSYSLAPKTAWKFEDETRKTEVEGWYQGAVRTCGLGRVAIFGEAAMFTAQTSATGRKIGLHADVAKDNQQLVLNLAAWLSGHSLR